MHGVGSGDAFFVRRARLASCQGRHPAGDDQGNDGDQHEHRRQHSAQHGNDRVSPRPAPVALPLRMSPGLDRLVVEEALQVGRQLAGAWDTGGPVRGSIALWTMVTRSRGTFGFSRSSRAGSLVVTCLISGLRSFSSKAGRNASSS